MRFFSRILTSAHESLAKREKRLSSRYPVGDNYPVRVTLRLDAQRRDVRLIDVSCNGASAELPPAHTVRRGQDGQISFTLGEDTLTLPCRVANVRQIRGRPACGLEFEFADTSKEEAYLQLVEPVALASSLEFINPAKVEQSVPGLRLEQYEGTAPTRLRVWRSLAEKEISAFEFQLSDYLVRWSDGMPELELIRSGSSRALSEAQRNELIWLFYLTVPNLPKSVAPDVREFLKQQVAA
ncbi:MAG: hypothetical protein C0518_15320 [Opitutus sp.]|nr:hypothetical protein [Opitutus sp.]